MTRTVDLVVRAMVLAHALRLSMRSGAADAFSSSYVLAMRDRRNGFGNASAKQRARTPVSWR